MAKVLPSKSRGHLLVAGIRVVQHKEGTPPRPEEVAELLQWGNEETYVVVRGLVNSGILRMHETPFEVRLEIVDHQKLEDLPEEGEGEALKDEVEEFRQADQSRKEKMNRMFESGHIDRRKKEETDDLEKQFAEFRKKKPRPPV